MVEVEGAVDVIAGAWVAVKMLPDCVTVMIGLLDVLDLRLVDRPAPSPAPSATARHTIAITASAQKALLRLVLETEWIGLSGWLNANSFNSLEPV